MSRARELVRELLRELDGCDVKAETPENWNAAFCTEAPSRDTLTLKLMATSERLWEIETTLDRLENRMQGVECAENMKAIGGPQYTPPVEDMARYILERASIIARRLDNITLNVG